MVRLASHYNYQGSDPNLTTGRVAFAARFFGGSKGLVGEVRDNNDYIVTRRRNTETTDYTSDALWLLYSNTNSPFTVGYSQPRERNDGLTVQERVAAGDSPVHRLGGTYRDSPVQRDLPLLLIGNYQGRTCDRTETDTGVTLFKTVAHYGGTERMEKGREES